MESVMAVVGKSNPDAEYAKMTSITWSNCLLQTLNTMRLQDDMCDVKIGLNDRTSIPAHSFVLAASSPFLKNLLKEQGSGILSLAVFPAEIVKQIVTFLYTGSAMIKKSDLFVFHSVCASLNITALAEMAMKLVKNNFVKKVQVKTQEVSTAPKQTTEEHASPESEASTFFQNVGLVRKSSIKIDYQKPKCTIPNTRARKRARIASKKGTPGKLVSILKSPIRKDKKKTLDEQAEDPFPISITPNMHSFSSTTSVALPSSSQENVKEPANSPAKISPGRPTILSQIAQDVYPRKRSDSGMETQFSKDNDESNIQESETCEQSTGIERSEDSNKMDKNEDSFSSLEADDDNEMKSEGETDGDDDEDFDYFDEIEENDNHK